MLVVACITRRAASLSGACVINCARKHGTCLVTFCVCCFQDGGLQQIALSDKELAVIDKQRPHNKTGYKNGFMDDPQIWVIKNI